VATTRLIANADKRRAESTRTRSGRLAVAAAAPFLSVLDFSLVNIAIPSIRSGLHASYGQIQLIVAGYTLSYAVFLITGGRLGDIAGRKRVYLLGMFGFTLSSALCAAAPSADSLIVLRLLQGFMAAMMVPQSLAIIRVTFPPEERDLAFGIFGAGLSLAMIIGQLAGGALVVYDPFGLSWRPIFLVSLPIGVAAMLAGRTLLEESLSPARLRLDPGGIAISSIALFILIYSLSQGREANWPAWSLVGIAAFIPLLIGFIWQQRRVAASTGAPLLELSLFSHRAFAVGLMVILTFFGGISGFFMMLTILLQTGLHMTAFDVGLVLSPFAIGFFLASVLSVRLAPRLGRRTLNVAAALLVLSFVATVCIIGAQGAGLRGSDLLVVLLFYGAGQGLMVAPLFNTIMSGIVGANAGSASGALSTVQQVAGSIGVAAIGTVFFGLLGRNPQVGDFVTAITRTLSCNIALIGITFVLVFLLPRCSPATKTHQDSGQPEPAV